MNTVDSNWYNKVNGPWEGESNSQNYNFLSIVLAPSAAFVIGRFQ